MLMSFEILIAVPRKALMTSDEIRLALQSLIVDAVQRGEIDATTCVVGQAKTIGAVE